MYEFNVILYNSFIVILFGLCNLLYLNVEFFIYRIMGYFRF